MVSAISSAYSDWETFGCLQGYHCPMVGCIQDSAQVICEERVEGSAGIPAQVLECETRFGSVKKRENFTRSRSVGALDDLNFV